MSKNHTLETILRSGLGAVPYIGTVLNESLFEHRSRVKQDRLNSLIELLVEYFSSRDGGDFNIDELDVEMLGDVFESVVLEAVKTGDKRKQLRLRNVLLGHIKSKNSDTELTQTFLELTSKMSDTQVQILENFTNNKSKTIEQRSEIARLEENLLSAKQKVYQFKKKAEAGTIELHESIASASKEEVTVLAQKMRAEDQLKQIENYKQPQYYNIDASEFIYYQRDLISKGLLYETFTSQMGTSSSQSSDKEITSFGEKYIEFIKMD